MLRCTSSLFFFRTRQHHHAAYSIGNLILDFVSTYKYRGVYFTNGLSWKTNIRSIVADSNRTFHFLCSNLPLAFVSETPRIR